MKLKLAKLTCKTLHFYARQREKRKKKKKE